MPERPTALKEHRLASIAGGTLGPALSVWFTAVLFPLPLVAAVTTGLTIVLPVAVALPTRADRRRGFLAVSLMHRAVSRDAPLAPAVRAGAEGERGSARTSLRALAEALETGHSVAEGLAAGRGLLTPMERARVAAAEAAGRLPGVLAELHAELGGELSADGGAREDAAPLRIIRGEVMFTLAVAASMYWLLQRPLGEFWPRISWDMGLASAEPPEPVGPPPRRWLTGDLADAIVPPAAAVALWLPAAAASTWVLLRTGDPRGAPPAEPPGVGWVNGHWPPRREACFARGYAAAAHALRSGSDLPEALRRGGAAAGAPAVARRFGEAGGGDLSRLPRSAGLLLRGCGGRTADALSLLARRHRERAASARLATDNLLRVGLLLLAAVPVAALAVAAQRPGVLLIHHLSVHAL